MKHSKHVIGPNETLMIKARALDGSTYWSDRECCTYATWDGVLSIVLSEDDVIKVVRFNDETRVGEDITEACAAAWIARQIGHTINELGNIPEWIEKSEAWAEHVEASAREAVERSDREEHSTLDHRTQGLRRE